MKKLIIIFIISVNVILYSKELHIYINETIKTIDTSKENPMQNIDSSKIELFLGNNYFYTISNDEKNLYDFKIKKIYNINLKNKTYSENSLYSIIGFKSSEIENRIFLHGILSKSGLENEKNPYNNLFDLEILFSIDHPKITNPNFISKKSKTEYTYKINKDIYTKYIFFLDKNIDNYKNIFEKYLIYYCSLHPLVRKEIMSKNLFFKELYYKIVDSFRKIEVTLNIEKIEESIEEHYFLPDSFKKILNSDEEILNIISSTEINKPKRYTKEEYIDIINNSINNNNYFEAYLIIVEYMLENGEILKNELQGVTPLLNSDNNLSLFLKSSTLYKEKKYEEAIQTYNSISRNNLKRDYNIDIQIAVMYMSLRKYDESVEYYLKALRQNPFITGVYKDLGDIFYNSYEMHIAWTIWDFAKQISPNHSILNSVFELENNLEKNFPEYF